MNRSRRFLAGVSFGYLHQVFVIAAGLWLTPFLLRHIGSHDFGLWLVGTQLLAYLLLLDLGVIALLSRDVSYAVGRAGSIQSAVDLPLLLAKGLRVILWQMPVVSLVVVAVWFLFPPEWKGLQYPFLPVLISFVIMFPLRMLFNTLVGLQDLAFTGRVQIAAWFITIVTTVLLAWAGQGLHALAWGWILGQAFQHVCCWIRLRNVYPEVIPSKFPAVSLRSAWNELRRGVWVSAAQISQVLLFGTDLLILGKLLGPEALVPYACTAKLMTVLSNQPNLLMQNAGPVLSEIRMSSSGGRLFSVCSALTQGMLLASGAVCCVVVLINGAFVRWWVGEGRYGGLLLTTFLVAMMLLRHWNTTLAYSNFSFGYEKRISLAALGDGTVTVISSVILVRWLGPLGAPLASILGACLISLPINLSDQARETESSRWKIVRTLAPLFGRIIVTSGLLMLVSRFWLPQGVWQIGLTAACGALVYAAFVWPLIARGPLRSYVEPRLIEVRSFLRRSSASSVAAATK